MKGKISRQYRDIVIIMRNLLNFNPYFRPTAFECLKSRAFDPYRNKWKEAIILEM